MTFEEARSGDWGKIVLLKPSSGQNRMSRERSAHGMILNGEHINRVPLFAF